MTATGRNLDGRAWAARRAATALAVLVLCLGAAEATAAGPSPVDAGKQRIAKHGKHRHPARKAPRGAYWGAWIGNHLTGTEAPWDMNAVGEMERRLGKGLSLIQFASPFADCSSTPCSFLRFPTKAIQAIRDYGAIPFLSWSSSSIPTEATLPDFQLSDVIAGTYDSYIREFAAEARDWGHPFFLRFNWEMNGDWFPWSEGVNGNQPGEYIAAWRHVHDIFASAGTTNATWVWCPYADSRPGRTPLKRFWPGAAYVGWTCLDGYNFSRTPVNPHPWRSFDAIFAPSYRSIVRRIAPRKPFLIGEMASNGIGRGKAIWIRRMFTMLARKYRRVRGLIWFNQFDRGMNWPLETSNVVLRAFRRGVRSKAYRANGYSGIAGGSIPPPG